MTGNAHRPRTLLRIEGAYRLLFKKYLCDSHASIEITEFPKSGGSWLGEMLSGATGLPFPRNTFPRSRRCIFHGHAISASRIKKKVVLWRDPRDVLVSWYHHCIIGNQKTNPGFVQECRASLGVTDIHDVNGNMDRFVRWCFDTPPSPSFSWVDFFDYWNGRNDVCHIRYEDLRHAPADAFGQLCSDLGYEIERPQIESIIEKFSFEAQTGRRPGEEDKNSFIRKGLVGDWRNVFDARALASFEERVEKRLEALGY